MTNDQSFCEDQQLELGPKKPAGSDRPVWFKLILQPPHDCQCILVPTPLGKQFVSMYAEKGCVSKDVHYSIASD